MSEKIKAGVIGATGYAGLELCRLLLMHPQAELVAISSKSFEGMELSEVYPALYRETAEKLCDSDEVIAKSEVVFGSVPHGLSEEYARKCVDKGAVFIDMGADFRLSDPADYKEWYGGEYKDTELHSRSTYALPEFFKENYKSCDVFGNPGCYPTSVALGIGPALEAGLVEKKLIIDSKSGATGAGRGLAQNTHFAELNEGFAPYKVAAHRHTPEIEETLTRLAGERVSVTFVPHLLPINRGIVSTIYADLVDGVTEAQVRAAYEARYEKARFVRLLPEGKIANLKYVKHSNYCDISLHFDRRCGKLIVVSAIDNMVKGAAGQAIQNMNLKFGLAEDAGLGMIPPAF